MTTHAGPNPSSAGAALRDRAEARLSGLRGSAPQPVGVDAARLWHELQVHQIELELQNQDLREARQVAEVALARFVALFDMAPVGYITTDPNGRIMQINRAGREMLGLHADLSVGVRLSDSVDPDRRLQFKRFLDCVFASGQTQSCEVQLRRPDGQPRTANFVGVYGGEQPECLVIADDVTECNAASAELDQYRARLEDMVEERTAELLEARHSADAANRAKSTFLANMSHELRTPMNAILGMTGLALRCTSDPKLRHQLTQVDRASRHLLAIINDILDFSKIEADRLVLNQDELTLDGLVGELLDLMGETITAKGLTFGLTLDPDLGSLPLTGDRLRIGQILLNLVGNAIKFTASGGVALRIQVAEEADTSLLVRFEVEDTGIGVAVAEIEGLFVAFQQADSSLTRKYGGTGLGLSISKRLAMLMGGTAGVRSVPGAGSTFWFTARLGKLADGAGFAPVLGATSAEERMIAGFQGRRVLLVEDDPLNQEVTIEILNAVGLSVVLAEDGDAAVAQATGGGFDLILMDLQLPRRSGLAATRSIRQAPLGRSVPIVATTANAFAEDRQACLAAGINDFVAKPFDPDTLYKTVLKWLTRAAASAP